MSFISLNGKIINAGTPVLLADNRSYRYGDGLFETLKIINGHIQLEVLHWERFFNGLRLLQFGTPPFFTTEKLSAHILDLCRKNNCEALARVRLSAFRGNGGLYEETGSFEYLIECWPLNPTVNQLNTNGLVVDLFTAARKSADSFSSIKSANFLPYTMAARHAKENHCNDSLVLNTNGGIADSTIANVFLYKKGILITPSLDQGCVAGVMRKYILEKWTSAGNIAEERSVLPEELPDAEEIFLTNAISGLKWVQQYREKKYNNASAVEIHREIIAPLFTNRK